MMDDDEIALTNACADLLALREYEAFPAHLLSDRSAGEWVGVHELCLRIELTPSGLKEELYATWLPDPVGGDEYCVIVFTDNESQWGMTARYNRGRLARGTPPGSANRTGKVAVPATGAELLAYWQSEGLIGTRTDIVDGPAHARDLREQAQERTRP